MVSVVASQKGHHMAMGKSKVEDFRKAGIAKWVVKHIDVQAIVVSDGPPCFNVVGEVSRQPYSVITGSGSNSVKLNDFTWVNTMIGDVQNFLIQT
jgi:hypothetical protein